MIPPLFIRFKNQRFGLWLPVFLVWPIALALWLIALPLFVVWAILTRRPRWGWAMIRVGFAFYKLICAFRGTLIDVHSDETKIRITIW